MNRALALCLIKSLSVSRDPLENLPHLGKFSEHDWEHTYSWLDDGGLALHLLNRLSEAGSEDLLPAAVRAKLQDRLASNRRRLREMRQEFARVNSYFDEAKIDYAVLKGFSLVPEYCPDAVLRSQYDYDYLVHPRSLANAQRVLQAAGFSSIRQSLYEPAGAVRFVSQPFGLPFSHQDYYSREIPRAVELHLSLWEPNREMIAIGTPQGALDRRQLVTWEGLPFPVLAEEDVLIFQSLHAFHHVLDYWCRLSCFLEIACCMARRRSDLSFWNRFLSRVNGCRFLPETVSLVFSMAEMLFDAPVPSEVNGWSSRQRLRNLRLWVERHGKNWALASHPGSKLSLLIHREFVDYPRTWRTVKWGRLFPLHRPARVSAGRNATLRSTWKASWHQWVFAFSRLAFHIKAAMSYAWYARSWNRALRHLQENNPS
jgi:Uncharacterised nucleotidyltransferase